MALCSKERRSSPARANSARLLRPRPSFYSGPAQPATKKGMAASDKKMEDFLSILKLFLPKYALSGRDVEFFFKFLLS